MAGDYGGRNSLMQNAEGYIDTTAGKAVHETDCPPTKMTDLIHTMKCMADIAGYEVFGRIWLRDKETGKEWR